MKKVDETGDLEPMVRAGQLMYASHWSYRNRCGLDCPETSLLVDLARDIGLEGGLYGAKITGGGSGGTVAVLGREEMVMDSVGKVVDAYKSRTGIDPDVFAGSSPGTLEFGHLEYMPV